MLYYYSGKQPEDPYAVSRMAEFQRTAFEEGQQSIIFKLVEVDLDAMEKAYGKYKRNLGGNPAGGYEIPIPFTQFIQQQMNLSNKSNSSQEGKTKYQATYNQDGSIDVYPQEASHDKDS